MNLKLIVNNNLGIKMKYHQTFLVQFSTAGEAKHPADDRSLLAVKVVIAQCAPHTLVPHLNPPRGQVVAIC